MEYSDEKEPLFCAGPAVLMVWLSVQKVSLLKFTSRSLNLM